MLPLYSNITLFGWLTCDIDILFCMVSNRVINHILFSVSCFTSFFAYCHKMHVCPEYYAIIMLHD